MRDREKIVRADEVKEGDTLILLSGRPVTVDRVDTYDGQLVVRWSRPAERGEPGHIGGKGEALLDALEGGWGRYLGSTIAYPPDRLLKIAIDGD